MSKGRKFLIAVSAMTLALVLGMVGFLHGQEAFVPENQVASLDEERSQGFLSGEGYQMDKEQEREHEKTEKKRQENLDRKEPPQPPTTQPPTTTQPSSSTAQTQTRSSSTARTSDQNTGNTGTSGQRTGTATQANTDNSRGSRAETGNRGNGTTVTSVKPKPTRSRTKPSSTRKKAGPGPGPTTTRKNPTKTPSKETAKKPTKKTTDGEDPVDKRSSKTKDTRAEEERDKDPKIDTNLNAGERHKGNTRTFWVRVTDYKNRNVPVYSNGEGAFTVTCNGEVVNSMGSNGNRTTFRAALMDGKNEIVIRAWDREGRTKTKTIPFTASGERVPVGTVSVTIAAPILHLGTLGGGEVDLYEGDSAKDVLDAAFEASGITPIYTKGGTYLSGIRRSGIARGAWISDKVREAMEELGQTEMNPDKQDPDSLSEKNFYNNNYSGWVFAVNGEYSEVGINSWTMEDGDELILVFSIYPGFTGIEELDGQSWED